MTRRAPSWTVPPAARVALRVAIAAALLAYLFHQVPLTRVADTLRGARPWAVAAACLALVAGIALASRRLEIFTDRLGLNLSLSRLFAINLGTGFYGLFVPGGTFTGGAIRFYKITRIEGQRARALAAIAFERIMATLFLCVVGVVLWAVELPTQAGAPGIAMAIALAIIVLLYVSLASRRLVAALVAALERLGLTGVGAKVRRLFDAFHQYRSLSPASLVVVVTLSIGIHVTGIVAYCLLARAVGITVSFVTLGWVRSAVLLLTTLPISVAGFGVREGTLLVLLRPYGVSGEQAIALSLLIFTVRLIVFGGLGGLVELMGLGGGAARGGASDGKT